MTLTNQFAKQQTEADVQRILDKVKAGEAVSLDDVKDYPDFWDTVVFVTFSKDSNALCYIQTNHPDLPSDLKAAIDINELKTHLSTAGKNFFSFTENIRTEENTSDTHKPYQMEVMANMDKLYMAATSKFEKITIEDSGTKQTFPLAYLNFRNYDFSVALTPRLKKKIEKTHLELASDNGTRWYRKDDILAYSIRQATEDTAQLDEGCRRGAKIDPRGNEAFITLYVKRAAFIDVVRVAYTDENIDILKQANKPQLNRDTVRKFQHAAQPKEFKAHLELLIQEATEEFSPIP